MKSHELPISRSAASCAECRRTAAAYGLHLEVEAIADQVLAAHGGYREISPEEGLPSGNGKNMVKRGLFWLIMVPPE
jgi:hypothetical protein